MLEDLRFAFRTLTRSPLFTAVAILSLALGIGANTAIFSLVDHVFLRKLPVPEPERLVLVKDPGPYGNGTAWSDDDGHSAFSHPVYLELRRKNQVFSGLAARWNIAVNVSQGNRNAEIYDAEIVSGNYFAVLGLEPALGRLFTDDDDRLPGAHPLVVLSHDCWRDRFASRRNVVGMKLLINAYPMTVIGVAPRGFTGTQTGRYPELFVPMMMKARATPGNDNLADRTNRWLHLMGRLKPGMSMEAATTGLRTALLPSIEQTMAQQPDLPADERKQALARRPYLRTGAYGRETFRNDVGESLLILFGMTGLVLLVACANVANLLIARGAAREREIAIRLSLGASRWALVRQLLVESAVLALTGGALGVLVATWSLTGLEALVPGETRAFVSTSLDQRTLVITFLVSIATGVIFGLLPAWQSTRSDLAIAMKSNGGSATATPAGVRFRRWLVASQFALSLILLVAGGLLARSLANLGRQNPGFDVERLVTFDMDASLSGYAPESTAATYANLRNRLAAIPGVRDASVVRLPILADRGWTASVKADNCAKSQGTERYNVGFNGVDAHFHRLLALPIEGRGFELTDDQEKAPKVAIVNETFARACWGTEPAVGRRVYLGRRGEPAAIVGVVKDARLGNIRKAPDPFVYLPIRQAPGMTRGSFYLRAAMPEAALIGAVERVVRQTDANLAVLDPRTLREQINETIYGERLTAVLSIAFALLAVTLAAVGLYGVLAFIVARRTREIGVRLALGAGSGKVQWLVLREVLWLAGAGLVAGFPAAWTLARVMKSLLYGLEPNDLSVFGLAGIAMAATAFVTGYWPARRASRIDPMTALRQD